MSKFASFAAMLLVLGCASLARGEDAGLAKLFEDRNLTGTIVICSMDGRTTYTHNDTRANTRLAPASTFKIPNTLIALEEGVVADEKEIITWGGKETGIPACNKDQCIETAFRASCVWFYQELAKRVGLEKYTVYLKKMKYGNEQAGSDVTTFWLNGDLKISAFEQIGFLEKVYAKAFDFKPRTYETLRKVMVVDQATTYTLRAKTGLAPKTTSQLGWYVGYVEAGDKVWFFAMNIDVTKPQDIPMRQEITKAALRLKGLL